MCLFLCVMLDVVFYDNWAYLIFENVDIDVGYDITVMITNSSYYQRIAIL